MFYPGDVVCSLSNPRNTFLIVRTGPILRGIRWTSERGGLRPMELDGWNVEAADRKEYVVLYNMNDVLGKVYGH